MSVICVHMCVIVSDVGECYLLCVHMCVIVSVVGECYLLCVQMCVIVSDVGECYLYGECSDLLCVHIVYLRRGTYTCVLSSPT